VVITEASRHQLHRKLAELLGDEEAAVLMEHLPPVGWADVATTRDLDLLRSDLEAVRSDLDGRIDRSRIQLEAHLDRRLADFTRTMMFGLIAAQATFVGLIVALVR
jgi:hypothetical protein